MLSTSHGSTMRATTSSESHTFSCGTPCEGQHTGEAPPMEKQFSASKRATRRPTNSESHTFFSCGTPSEGKQTGEAPPKKKQCSASKSAKLRRNYGPPVLGSECLYPAKIEGTAYEPSSSDFKDATQRETDEEAYSRKQQPNSTGSLWKFCILGIMMVLLVLMSLQHYGKTYSRRRLPNKKPFLNSCKKFDCHDEKLPPQHDNQIILQDNEQCVRFHNCYDASFGTKCNMGCGFFVSYVLFGWFTIPTYLLRACFCGCCGDETIVWMWNGFARCFCSSKFWCDDCCCDDDCQMDASEKMSTSNCFTSPCTRKEMKKCMDENPEDNNKCWVLSGALAGLGTAAAATICGIPAVLPNTDNKFIWEGETFKKWNTVLKYKDSNGRVTTIRKGEGHNEWEEWVTSGEIPGEHRKPEGIIARYADDKNVNVPLSNIKLNGELLVDPKKSLEESVTSPDFNDRAFVTIVQTKLTQNGIDANKAETYSHDLTKLITATEGEWKIAKDILELKKCELSFHYVNNPLVEDVDAFKKLLDTETIKYTHDVMSSSIFLEGDAVDEVQAILGDPDKINGRIEIATTENISEEDLIDALQGVDVEVGRDVDDEGNDVFTVKGNAGNLREAEDILEGRVSFEKKNAIVVPEIEEEAVITFTLSDETNIPEDLIDFEKVVGVTADGGVNYLQIDEFGYYTNNNVWLGLSLMCIIILVGLFWFVYFLWYWCGSWKKVEMGGEPSVISTTIPPSPITELTSYPGVPEKRYEVVTLVE